MMNSIEKELKDISWNVDEAVYRGDRALSYSTLSTFARTGVKGLKSVLIDKTNLDTAALRHGSAVDTLLTDRENFNNIYIVSNFDKPSDIIKSIVDLIWKNSDKSINDLKKIDKSILLNAIEKIGYGAATWKEETKINKVIEEGNKYFNLLSLTSNGRKILHEDDYKLALKCVNALKSNNFTSWIFKNNPTFKVYYQLKFKITFTKFEDNNNLEWKNQIVEYNTIRCMFDIIIVDYSNKIIIPIDLKTTYHNEEDFIISIQDWYYDLQATMYSYILRQVCKNDNYFKQFSIKPFYFLPINKFNLSPQLYEYETSINDLQKSFLDYQNRWHLAWYDYLDTVRWHIDNNEFKYNKFTVLNNGINKVRFI